MKVRMLSFRNTPTKAAATIAVACALCAGALIPASTATAATPRILTATQQEGVRANMTAAGIDETTQERLLDKLNAGQALDSQLDTSLPVSSYSTETKGVTKAVDVFGDGSVRWTEQSVPTSANTRLNVGKGGCGSSGGWQTNCRISISDLDSNAGFYIDYTTGKVRDYRAAYCNNAIGSCSVSGGVKRAAQSSAGPAWAELKFTASIGPIGGVANGAFGIRVNGGTASVYG